VSNGCPSARQEVILFSGITKRYGELIAVDDISLHVEQGEIFGLVGPNGAAKTTLIEMLEGLRTPDAGSIDVLGPGGAVGHALLLPLGAPTWFGSAIGREQPC